MKIAIIAAMRKELDLILRQIPEHTERQVDDYSVYEFSSHRHEFVLSQCGIGKVNSALRTQRIIETFEPELVINSGVAGGLDPSMHIGDVLIPDRVAYHDVWCGPGTEYGQADGCPLFFTPYSSGLEKLRTLSAKRGNTHRFGLLCSGDKFISTPEEVSEIKGHFPDALGCDMESASIAQACYKNRVPFMIIRVMSDMPGGGENLSEYENFWADAPAKTFETLSDFIGML